jgi:hypothetical protein
MVRRKGSAPVALLLAGVLTLGFSFYAERATATPLGDGWTRILDVWHSLVSGPDGAISHRAHTTYAPPPSGYPPPCYYVPPGSHLPVPPGFRPCPTRPSGPPPCYGVPPGSHIPVPPGFRPCPVKP